MKPLIIEKNNSLGKSLYLQIYYGIKEQITSGTMKLQEKLPSIRQLATTLDLSVTTVALAYDQLLTEGYIVSKARSGYFVNANFSPYYKESDEGESLSMEMDDYTFKSSPYLYDLSIFDIVKWKKCQNRVYGEYAHLLMFESEPQGESALRFEISKYLYNSRGVQCTPEQVVIGAGTQQTANHLCKILKRVKISHLSTEDPGYTPLQQIFKDNDFSIGKIPVTSDGIEIDKLPQNISSVVYVSPSNQFPTGAVMPINSRYKLLEWAKNNNSYIIEDDYDSELRYFGKTIPALQGLDKDGKVIYLGSFSSTLLPSVKISYMVLPKKLSTIFQKIKKDYSQSCSKTEQLTLALFMEDGYYYSNIRKLRKLYSQKLQLFISSFEKYAKDKITAVNTKSGINLILIIKSEKSSKELCKIWEDAGLNLKYIDHPWKYKNSYVFYYNQVPIDKIEEKVKLLSKQI